MITGANRGFGRALSRAYPSGSARVFPLVRMRVHADGPGAFLCVFMFADVRDDAVTGTLSSAVRASGGRFDRLVNNARASGSGMRLDVFDAQVLFSQFDLHCAGVKRCAKTALPFLETFAPEMVANLSSRLGSLSKNAAGDFSGGEYFYDYRIAKAVQNTLTLCMGMEFPADGIAVCAIHPGEIVTGSDSADASVNPDMVAASFVEFFYGANKDINGRCFDHFGGGVPW